MFCTDIDTGPTRPWSPFTPKASCPALGTPIAVAVTVLFALLLLLNRMPTPFGTVVTEPAVDTAREPDPEVDDIVDEDRDTEGMEFPDGLVIDTTLATLRGSLAPPVVLVVAENMLRG